MNDKFSLRDYPLKAASLYVSALSFILENTIVSWYLQSDTNGKFRALPGAKHTIERKLLKFDNPGQLVLDENTMLYSQVRPNVPENQEVRTNIFKFDVAEVVQNLKDRKGANDFLLGNKSGQLNIASSINSNPGKINFLQYVRRTGGDDLVAFLAKKQSSNTQELHLARLAKRGAKSNFIVVSKMNDKFSLRDYPLKAASLYVSALSFILENTILFVNVKIL